VYQVNCPHCGSVLDNDGSLTGQEIVCPACSGIFRVPGPTAPVERPADRFTAPQPQPLPGPAESVTASVSQTAAMPGPSSRGAGPEAPPVYEPDPFPKIDRTARPHSAAPEAAASDEPGRSRVLIYSLLGLVLFLLALIGAVAGGRYVRDRMEGQASGEKTVEEWIGQLQKGRDQQSRREAAEALLQQGPEAVSAALRAITSVGQDGNTLSINPRAVQAMAESGPAAVDAMVQALASETLDVRVAAAYILREMGSKSKGAVEALARAAGDKNPRVRWYAMDALANAGPDAAPAIETLIPLVSDQERFTRRRAIVALGKIGPKAKAAVPILTKVQQEERDQSIRDAAGTALQLINLAGIAQESIKDASDEVKQLVKRLQDKDEYESVPAAKALGRMGREAVEAVPALAQALQRSEKWVREAAAEALGAMGRDARPYLPALQRAAEDREPEVREAAQKAVEKITGAKPKEG
jgi:HEAT repeat protein